MKPRYYMHMFDDNFNGVRNHRAAELINRLPLQGKVVRPSRAVQVFSAQRAVSTRLGKVLIGKLAQLGIK